MGGFIVYWEKIAFLFVFLFLVLSLGVSGFVNQEESQEKAEFEVINLEASLSEVTPGETVNISVHVENVVETKGTKTVGFSIDGEMLARNISLEAGKTDIVSVSLDIAAIPVVEAPTGTYNVIVAGMNNKFNIIKNKEADLEINNLQVSPRKIGSSETVSVSVDMNVRREQGTQTV
ncbi:MAG: Cell surface protein [Candidatus Methanohalarchaeum thermophilum]|uniref:Cell surface protein n=1 Tax=Methanohalarchaeum thermophilum TaxID=1903181 RepID=A0A1Q6DW29_METT1|nr:MAG: Cell surface protein [Candidatus Methanohalarchaeum thermophilum]